MDEICSIERGQGKKIIPKFLADVTGCIKFSDRDRSG